MTTTARMMKTAIRTIMINIAVPVLMAFTTITVLLIIVVVCMLYQSSHIIIIYLHKPCHHTRFLSYSSRSPQDNSSASIVRAATNEGNMKKLHIYIYIEIYWKKNIYIYTFSYPTDWHWLTSQHWISGHDRHCGLLKGWRQARRWQHGLCVAGASAGETLGTWKWRFPKRISSSRNSSSAFGWWPSRVENKILIIFDCLFKTPPQNHALKKEVYSIWSTYTDTTCKANGTNSHVLE